MIYKLMGLLLILAPISSQAHAVLVTFDTPGDLASNFTLTGTAGAYTQTTTGGITGGGVDSVILGNHSAIHNSSFAPVGVTSNFFYKYLSAAGGAQVRLAFVANATTFIGNSPTTFFRLEHYGGNHIGFVNVDGATVTVPIDTTIPTPVAGNWYQLSLTARPAGGNNFNITIALQDYGSLGTAAGSVLYSNSFAVANATAALDTSWQAGFYSDPSATGLVDNFFVALVPEVGGGLLVGMIGIAALLHRLCFLR